MIHFSYTAMDENLPHESGQASYSYTIGICTVPTSVKIQLGYEQAGAVQTVMDTNHDTHVMGLINQAELMSGSK